MLYFTFPLNPGFYKHAISVLDLEQQEICYMLIIDLPSKKFSIFALYLKVARHELYYHTFTFTCFKVDCFTKIGMCGYDQSFAT